MITRHHRMKSNCAREAIPGWLAGLCLVVGLVSGCGCSSQEAATHQQVEEQDVESGIDVQTATPPISLVDLDKFRPGKSRRQILEELHWQGAGAEMGGCDGAVICAITYAVCAYSWKDERPAIWVHAIFVDDKFEKFIPWSTDPKDITIGPGRNVTGTLQAGDCLRLSRALKAAAISTEDLRSEAMKSTAPQEQIDWELTAVWLLMRPALADTSAKPPTLEEFRRNAQLRDQFKAARLNLGMEESAVQETLRAKPLEDGHTDIGAYEIFGSNETFNLDGWSHFSNVLVVFREGKVIAAYDIRGGKEWRQRLGRTFVDLGRR